MRRLFNYRTVTIILLALMISAVAYGFAAANTMPANTYAGEGAATVSGYTVSAVTYTLDSNYPSKITAVDFTINNAPATLRVGLSDGATTTWADSCTLSTTPTCSFTTGGGVSTLATTQLVVVAAD
ncbi:MAG: hypothetical protein GY755_23680 [Chloroflexi bacterium]|nr:hypothetical protein [Chloroflexota bacterium]